VLLAVWLRGRLFLEVPVLVKLQENVLSDRRLLGCRSPSPFVKRNVEPLIDFAMNLVKLVALTASVQPCATIISHIRVLDR